MSSKKYLTVQPTSCLGGKKYQHEPTKRAKDMDIARGSIYIIQLSNYEDQGHGYALKPFLLLNKGHDNTVNGYKERVKTGKLKVQINNSQFKNKFKMAKFIVGSIDLNKIDKSRIKSTDKDGNPFKDSAKYYNIGIMLNDDPDKFGNEVAITQGQTKEQREAKEKNIYIGNAKVVWSGDSNKPATPETNKINRETHSDQLPF